MRQLLQHLWSAARWGLWFLRAVGYNVSRLALAGIVVAFALEVVSRYLFNAPTSWSSDLVSYLLCVVVFTMMPHVTASGSQVAVTVMVDALPDRYRQTMMRLIYLLGFLACAAMAWFAGGETVRQIVREIQMLAIHPIPKWWVSVWIGIGFGLSSLEYLRLACSRDAAPDRSPVPPAEI